MTETIQSLLAEAQNANLIPALAQSTQQFETTSKDASIFLNNADQAVEEIDLLVKQLRAEAAKVRPMIENLNAATGNAVKASVHVNNIVAALDNPKTLNELQADGCQCLTAHRQDRFRRRRCRSTDGRSRVHEGRAQSHHRPG